MKFKGKIDKWWYLVTLFINFCLIIIWVTSSNAASWKLYLPLIILLDLFLIPPVFHNEITVTNELVIIDFGFFKRNIPIVDIVSLRHSTNKYSIISATFDNVGIITKLMGEIRVGVVDQKGFVTELKKHKKKMPYYL